MSEEESIIEFLEIYACKERKLEPTHVAKTLTSSSVSKEALTFLKCFQSSKISRKIGWKKRIGIDKNNLNIKENIGNDTTISLRWSAKGDGFSFENNKNCFWVGFREDVFNGDSAFSGVIHALPKQKNIKVVGKWSYYPFQDTAEIEDFFIRTENL